MDNLKVGMVVHLKSGGPKMTIVRLTPLEYAICSWIDKAGKPYEKEFKVEALEEFKEKKPRQVFPTR